MITETQSCAFDIRDTFFEAVSGDAYFANYTAKKNRMLQVQPDLLPYLGVYLVEEQMTPDGDANAGCIRFSHTARIGFSVIVVNNDRDVAEAASDKAYLKIQTILYTDPQIMNVLHNANVENVGIESIQRGTRKHVYGNTGQNNETPFIEMQYEVYVFFRSEWYPDITDTLDTIHVTTGIKPGDTQQEMDQRYQVAPVYDFTTSRKGSDNGRRADEGPADPWTTAKGKDQADGGTSPPGSPRSPYQGRVQTSPRPPQRSRFPK